MLSDAFTHIFRDGPFTCRQHRGAIPGLGFLNPLLEPGVGPFRHETNACVNSAFWWVGSGDFRAGGWKLFSKGKVKDSKTELQDFVGTFGFFTPI